MPSLSKKAYDLVSDEIYDSRAPLQEDLALDQGTTFQAKFIGSLDIPRPSSKVEIVAAMRRIRYEFKAKAIKKKKVSLLISVDGGLKVVLRKTKRRRQWRWEDSRLLMQHPIYRIFYVSHDSHDLKIWSYIAREIPSNSFKCNVFKAYKKSQATRIVRTLGQAFEVWNAMSLTPTPSPKHTDQHTDRSPEDRHARVNEEGETIEEEEEEGERGNQAANENAEKQPPPHHLPFTCSRFQPVTENEQRPPSSVPHTVGGGTDIHVDTGPPGPLSSPHHLLLLRQKLEQQQHQTQAAIAQLHLLKDHLSAETAARIEAQARSQQLLLHNRDLLDHVTQLVSRLQVLEEQVHTPLPPPPVHPAGQVSQLPDPASLTLAPLCLPDANTPPPNPYLPHSLRDNSNTFANSRAAVLDSQSPDSGHREMSSDSLALLTGHLVTTGQAADSVVVSSSRSGELERCSGCLLVTTSLSTATAAHTSSSSCGASRALGIGTEVEKSQNDRLKSATLSQNDQLKTPTLSQNDHLKTPTLSQNDHLKTPTLSQNDHLKTPTLSQNDQLKTPTLSQNDQLKTPTLSQNDQLKNPTLSQNDRVKATSLSQAVGFNKSDISLQFTESAANGDLNSATFLPRIEPPPRVRRTCRKLQRTSHCYGGGGRSGVSSPVWGSKPDVKVHLPKSVSDSDYFYTSSGGGSCTGDGVRFRRTDHTKKSSDISDRKRYSDSITFSSTISNGGCENINSLCNPFKAEALSGDFNHSSIARSGYPDKTELIVGDFNHSSLGRSGYPDKAELIVGDFNHSSLVGSGEKDSGQVLENNENVQDLQVNSEMHHPYHPNVLNRDNDVLQNSEHFLHSQGQTRNDINCADQPGTDEDYAETFGSTSDEVHGISDHVKDP